MTSIRRQLTWKLLAVFAGPIALGGVAGFLIVRHSLLEEFDATLMARATAISSITHVQGDRVTLERDSPVLRRFQGRDTDADGTGRRDDDDDDAAYFEMWRSDGSVVARSSSLGNASLPFVAEIAGGERRRVWDTSIGNGLMSRAVAWRFFPRSAPGEPLVSHAPLVLVVAASRGEVDRTLRLLELVFGATGLVLLAAVSLLVPRLLKRELNPIDRLADQAAAVTPDSLSTRFSTEPVPAELAPIVARLNDLLSRLEEAFERERQFSGDLAHELRTPIAELRSIAEVAIKWPEGRSSESDHETLAIALQMEGTVTRLLALLRGESGQLPVSQQSVSLASEVDLAWRPFAKRADRRGLQVSMEVDPNVTITSDPVLLRSILTNLCDNASEYATEGGTVTVSAARTDEGWCVEIANEVAGLAAADVSKLFDRFWRQDAARTSGEHSGLGLSLAQTFARLIGAKLTAQLRGTQLSMALRGV